MTSRDDRRRAFTFVLAFALALWTITIVRAAWLSDDAYITLRTVDNVVSGHGLTWNPTERVQAYTHPLWMAALTGLYVVTRDAYATALALGLGVSTVAVGLLVKRLAHEERAALLSVTLLALSRAFVDYATSGLENPLTHLLFVLFCIRFFRGAPSPAKLLQLSFLASLAGLNRLDALALYLPPLLYVLVRLGLSRRAIAYGLLGQLPLVLWTCFSLFYYGFPFPNTAYAKLNTGIPLREQVIQGGIYLLDTLIHDPLTMLTLVTALVLVLIRRNGRHLALMGGAALYLLYIVRIGGDFMSGRFLTAPLLCSVIVIARHDLWAVPIPAYLASLTLALAVGLQATHPTLLLGNLDYDQATADAAIRGTGIADEAVFYGRDLAPANAQRDVSMPQHPWREQGEQLRAAEATVVVRDKSIGLYGYYAGPEVHIVDRLALTDPLLARLPAIRNANWRPGHFERRLPAGYLETLQFRRNALADPQLAAYYDALTYITRGPLWEPGRWREILRMNLGHYDTLIDTDAFRYPERVDVSAEALTIGQVEDIADAEDGLVFGRSGCRISFPDVVHAPQLELSLDSDDDVELQYLLDGRLVARLTVRAAHYPREKLAVYLTETPRRAQRRGFDAVHILPLSETSPYRVGHLLTHDPAAWRACSRQAACTLDFSDPASYWLLGRGWATPENWGRWNLGPQSTLDLYTQAGVPYDLQIEAFPLQTGETCPQTLRLWWNDHYAGERAFTDCDSQTLSFAIEGQWVRARNHLEFVYDRVYDAETVESPLPGETRPLAVGFIALRLTPAH